MNAHLRRLPTPASEPPLEGAGPTAAVAESVQGTLALSFVLRGGAEARPRLPALRLVPSLDPLGGDDPHFAPQPTPRRALPDPAPWAGRFVQGLVEVLAGSRPPAQLVRWTTDEVYAAVQDERQRLRAVPVVDSGCTQAPRRTRLQLRSLHLFEPADGVAEVTATVQRGPRAAAVALRLEGIDGRWRCTALALP